MEDRKKELIEELLSLEPNSLRDLRDKITFKSLIEIINDLTDTLPERDITREEFTNFLSNLRSLIESLEEKINLYSLAASSAENVLYIYYLFTKIYELLWRVSDIYEFATLLDKQIQFIPFIREIALIKENNYFCILPDKPDDFVDWTLQYIAKNKPRESTLVEVDELKGLALILPVQTSKNRYIISILLTRKRYLDWEENLFLTDLPSLFSLTLKLLEDKEEENLFFDSVTKLPRQTYFLNRLEYLIEKAHIKNELLIVGIVDLDKFTAINQVFGYEVGDEILVEISRRLSSKIESGEIGRGRGSSFIFVCVTKSPQDFLKNLKSFLSEPVSTTKGLVEITLSIGASLFPNDSNDARVLLRCAESALKEAKKDGGNNICFYRSDIFSKASAYLTLLPKMKRALQNQEFILYCQPRIGLKEKKVAGGEILLRWLSPEEGLILPGKFVWVLEESGLIRDLGFWIVENTCRLISQLERDLYLALNLSLNLSPQQLKETDIVEKLGGIFSKFQICPSKLTIEITENIFIDKPEEILNQIKALSELGIKVALDDFGTGYSSFKYLSIIPFNDLKIDLVFIKNMLLSYTDMEIVRTIVSLGKILEKKVVAEGVETREQLRVLYDLGVDEAQGYLFAPPLPWSKFLEFVNNFKFDYL